MTPQEHYDEAERLLAAGVEVVTKISKAGEAYNGPQIGSEFEKWVTKRRDELGKQAMGIWAQAQVHATLATAPPGLGRG